MGATACVVAVPMLGRAEAAQPLADSLSSSLRDHQARLLFVVNAPDRATRRACAATGADVSVIEGPRRPGDYARKINAALALTRERWIFTGASDLVFHPGWLDEALALGDARPPGVVGTNDLGNPLVKAGRMSTHSLVHRDYAETAVIDAPGQLYSEAYDHNYCDMELVAYARHRGRWCFARRAVVEHRHPSWRKAKMDATYEVSLDGMLPDQQLWTTRQLLWRPLTMAQRRRQEQRARLRRKAST